ncbi:MAG: hypothetical protein OEZ43_19610 [Gammaproteobacteria bacterium]|nr:hypothetical protein [Gammaproteobacteria bacterium]
MLELVSKVNIKNRMKFVIPVVLVFFPTLVFSYQTGPEKSPLVPSLIYYQPGNGLYIEFNEGAMPGCSADKGGRLVKGTDTDDRNFKELYSLILTMSTTKSMKGQILYDTTTSGGWWHCSIVGIVAKP